MNPTCHIPHYRKRKPRKEESGCKNHIDPTPVEVNDGHKYVLESKVNIINISSLVGLSFGEVRLDLLWKGWVWFRVDLGGLVRLGNVCNWVRVN